jgi:hypothetical protein
LAIHLSRSANEVENIEVFYGPEAVLVRAYFHECERRLRLIGMLNKSRQPESGPTELAPPRIAPTVNAVRWPVTSRDFAVTRSAQTSATRAGAIWITECRCDPLRSTQRCAFGSCRYSDDSGAAPSGCPCWR